MWLTWKFFWVKEGGEEREKVCIRETVSQSVCQYEEQRSLRCFYSSTDFLTKCGQSSGECALSELCRGAFSVGAVWVWHMCFSFTLSYLRFACRSLTCCSCIKQTRFPHRTKIDALCFGPTLSGAQIFAMIWVRQISTGNFCFPSMCWFNSSYF